MLYHLRRAKRDPEKNRQLVAKTLPDDLVKVMELVNKLEDEPKVPVEEPSEKTPPKRITGKTSPQKIGNSPASSSRPSMVKPKAKAKAKGKVSKPAQKPAAKPQVPVVHYKKDYYKNGNSYGFKKFINKKYINQIFSFGGKYQSKTFLDALATKVLADLNNKACGDASKEEEIELVARYKCWKQSKGSS
eukprot:Skav220240  [mRNA]  locus=scaffold3452:1244:1810:- [translate_table: standard]